MSEVAGRRVLVTGASGFLGGHLVRHLVDRGAHVVAAVGQGTPLWHGPTGPAETLALELRDDLSVRRVAEAARPELVFHLAARVDLSRDPRVAAHLYDVNTAGTVRLASALLDLTPSAASRPLARFVQVGTCEVYGGCEAPFTETQREQPVSPYSASKLAASHHMLMLHRSLGFPAVVVRPFLTYGPGQRRRGLVTSVIEAGLVGGPLRLTGGEQTRELNHVDDIVAGLVAAAVRPGAEGEVFNLGCGEPHTVRSLVERILALMGARLTPDFGALPYRDGETWRFHCDPSKARERLGWQPQVDLDEGLRRTIAWFREHGAATLE